MAIILQSEPLLSSSRLPSQRFPPIRLSYLPSKRHFALHLVEAKSKKHYLPRDVVHARRHFHISWEYHCIPWHPGRSPKSPKRLQSPKRSISPECPRRPRHPGSPSMLRLLRQLFRCPSVESQTFERAGTTERFSWNTRTRA